MNLLLFYLFLLLMAYGPLQDFALAQGNIYKLPELVVTATKTVHTIEDSPVETTVISQEDIENSSALTVSDLLRYTPGFFIRSENIPGISGWRSKLRGLDFNSGYGLILVDGQRIKGGGMGEYGYGLNQVPLELIDHIEIVKGPGSVLYGSDAMAGVVNIITKPIPEMPHLGLYTLLGSHDAKVFDLTAGTPLLDKRAGILLNIDREESDRAKYGAREDDYERNHIFSKIEYSLTNWLKINFAYKWEERDREYADERKTRISPAISLDMPKGGRFKVSGYLYDWDFHHFTPGYTERKGDMYYRQLEGLYTQPIGDIHLLSIGGEYLEEELDYNLANKTIDTKSLFFQDEIRMEAFQHLLSFSLGGRVDDHSVFGSEFSPRLAAMLTLDSSSRIRLMVGRAFKSPTIRQLYYEVPFRHGSYWYKSNPDLKPEYSWGYSVNLEKKFFKKHLFSMSLFRNDIDDMVARVETDDEIDGLPVVSYENINKAYTQGIELNLSLALFEKATLSIDYTFLDTEDKETHKNLTYSPKNTLALRLGYHIDNIGLRLFIGTQFMDKMYKDRENKKEINSYWLTEAKIIEDINSCVSLALELDNLFDSNYGEPERDWLGRTVFFSLKINI